MLINLPQFETLCVCASVCFVLLHLQELCVDLELGNRPALLGGSLSALLDPSEQVVDGTRNDTQLVLLDADVEAGSHGVRLSRTRLRAGEETDASVSLSNGVSSLIACVFQP